MDISDIEIAYFTMEIGLDSKIPTYSGGLGVLAGDTLRSAADLNLPVVGISLMYKKGYFQQKINEDGSQFEVDPHWHPNYHLKKINISVEMIIDGRKVKIVPWYYKLQGLNGRENYVLFLDSDIIPNSDFDRTITKNLYGGDDYYRLCQEMILGIGGVKILTALGAKNINKYHMNEGHSSLLTLELNKKLRTRGNLEKVRKCCVFTTHTPVPAGHDQFDSDMAKKVLGKYITPTIEKEIFIDNKLNMTYLGIRFSKYINGVAKKHGEISRSMFPGYQIESITNGVHALHWTTESFRKLYDKFIPGWRNDPFYLRYVLSIKKEDIWNAHLIAKRKFAAYVKKLNGVTLDPKKFTIGFARRAAAYKRSDMLFSQIERLNKIAGKFDGIQIVYSGKAHPRDTEGKEMIKRIINSMKEFGGNVTYIENYNMDIANLMIPGCDIWLNTPLRPNEASGTSGMKAAINGVPHFSVLDGWWLEGHIENITGWSIGTHPDISHEVNLQEEIDDLYTKLEYVIIPKYYKERDSWIEVMRHAIAINGSFFNTHRMVKQYVLNAYFM